MKNAVKYLTYNTFRLTWKVVSFQQLPNSATSKHLNLICLTKKNCFACFFINILAVGQESYPQALDDYSFDEDSSDALSPDQPASQESQGSASPGEPKTSDSPSPITPNATTSTQVQF